MIKSVCAVFDVKGMLYSNPFYAVNNAVAIRDFTAACSDSSSALFRNPEDYSLFQLATFDDVSGLFTPLVPPLHLSAAVPSNLSGE